eukprot:403333011
MLLMGSGSVPPQYVDKLRDEIIENQRIRENQEIEQKQVQQQESVTENQQTNSTTLTEDQIEVLRQQKQLLKEHKRLQKQEQQQFDHMLIGSNTFEVASLRIALSEHKIQTKYFSVNGALPTHNQLQNSQQQAKQDQQQQALSTLQNPYERNLIEESARLITQKELASRDLLDLQKINVDSYKALIIPSFCFGYNRAIMNQAYHLALLRSTIKEFHVKQKFIIALGPTSINLVSKVLGIKEGKVQPYPYIKQNEAFAFRYYEDDRVLYLPYRSELLFMDKNKAQNEQLNLEQNQDLKITIEGESDEAKLKRKKAEEEDYMRQKDLKKHSDNPKLMYEFHKEIESLILSLKYRVLKTLPQKETEEQK